MARGFIKGHRDQLYLLPPSIDDWISKNHSVRLIDSCVENIDLSSFYESYSHEGKPPYDPAMMIRILIYAYSKGIRSSRKISALCEEDIAFRWLTGNIIPDHSAICRFRAKHKENFKQLFRETIRLAAESGALKIGSLFLDGTKVKGSASLEANRNLEHIKQDIERIVDEAEAVDASEDKQLGEDNRDDVLPPELADPKSRLERLKAAKARLEAEKEAAAKESRDDDDSNGPGAGTGDEKTATGNKEKANITDPDSRIMKTRNGWVQGYNCQGVSDENQFIVANAVTQDCNDAHQLEPMLQAAQDNLFKIETGQNTETFSADAGYWAEGLDISKIESNGPEVIVATRKGWKQRKQNREKSPPRGRIPKGLSQRELMERKLLTQRGQRIYAKRGQTIEAIFGQLKECLGYRNFLLRSLKKVQGEWDLQCAVSNMLKLFRLSGATTSQ
mgnify:CR=1 FL=1